MGGDVKVMIVEDDPGIRALLRVLLDERGHDVREVDRGDEALAAARAFGPSVVLLDVGLPGLDGISVLGQLKNDPGLRDVPVLMVTAWDDADRMGRAHALGAADYVRKPFDPMDLLERMDAALVVAARR